MIQYKYGDVLAVDTGIIVHQCNAQGVMGSGIARQIREQFPAAYMAYKQQEHDHGLRLGDISFVRVGTKKYIVNLIGQASFGGSQVHTSYKALEGGFKRILKLRLNLIYDGSPALDICMPRIGCGLGNGSWDEVEKVIRRVIPDDVIVKVYDWMV